MYRSRAMLIGKRDHTRAEFEAYIGLPENTGKQLEYIDGEIVEHMPSFGYSSAVGARLTTLVGMYLLHNDIAHMTDAQGGYDLDDANTFAPDIGVILKARLPIMPEDAFIAVIPDLVIEVVSKSDLNDPKLRIEKKLRTYLTRGVRLILYVYPDRKEIDIHRPGETKQTVGLDGTVDCGDVLPGLTLRVHDVFP
jgi:Uma2 family endonuclease